MDTVVNSQTNLVNEAAHPTSGAHDRCLFILTPNDKKCGIEDFACVALSNLQRFHPDQGYAALVVSGLWRDFPSVVRKIVRAKQIVFNVPLLPWRRLVVLPISIALIANLCGCRVTVVMHEWPGLHRFRKLALTPLLWLAETVIVVSPLIASELARVRALFGVRRKCRLIPNAPTIRRPSFQRVTERVLGVQNARSSCNIVIGTFGAIYRDKGTSALLDICKHLQDRGIRALCVFVGGFTKSIDGYEQEFWSKVEEYGINDRVIVTGYIADAAELYTLFEQIDAFVFLFSEGLTSRRSSVVHCLQSDRPIVVTTPMSTSEFAHHRHFMDQVNRGGLSFVDTNADLRTIADNVLAIAGAPRDTKAVLDPEIWWKTTTARTHAVLSES